MNLFAYLIRDLLAQAVSPVYPWQAVRGFMLLGGVILALVIIIWVL